MPAASRAQDAFGDRPDVRGPRRRAAGRSARSAGRTRRPSGLRRSTPRVKVLGASSDHLILDVDDLAGAPALGDAIGFVPSYAATLALFTSPYVAKEWVGGQ